VTSITEITIIGGDRLQVQGDAKHIEAQILSAARGSILEFAWMTEATTGQQIGVNPDQVVLLRAVDIGGDAGEAPAG
jgi:hypothetical protein